MLCKIFFQYFDEIHVIPCVHTFRVLKKIKKKNEIRQFKFFMGFIYTLHRIGMKPLGIVLVAITVINRKKKTASEIYQVLDANYINAV